MSTVVTGAAGFAGRWLCAALAQDGESVSAWVHRPCTSPPAGRVHVVDLTDPDAVADAVKRASPSRVFHLAAVTNPREAESDPVRARAVNVLGTRHLFQALPPSCKAVYVSTCHVYGPPAVLPLCGQAPTRPQGVYARTKLEGEGEALKHPNSVVARAFHHTGPGQDPTYALADWARQLQNGARILRVGALSVRRDYLDVRDAIEGYRVLAARAQPGDIVPVCSGRSEALSTLLAWLVDGDQVDIKVQSNRIRPSEVPDLYGDPGRLHALGWKPRYRLQDTLRALRKTRPPP